MDEFEKFYIKTAHFLSYRPRSEKEIRDNLLKKKAPQEVIEKVITTMKQQHFIDDNDFARWWMRQRTEYRPKSKRVIGFELLQKGVSKEIIDEVIAAPDEEIKNDREVARAIVAKRFHKYKGLPKEEIYKKLGSFLARRGFDWETIRRSIDDKLDSEYNGR